MLPHHPQEDLAKFGYWFQPMFQIGWNLLSKYDNFSVFPPLKMWVIWAIFFKKILCMFCTAFFSFFFCHQMAPFRQKEEILHHVECLFLTKIWKKLWNFMFFYCKFDYFAFNFWGKKLLPNYFFIITKLKKRKPWDLWPNKWFLSPRKPKKKKSKKKVNKYSIRHPSR